MRHNTGDAYRRTVYKKNLAACGDLAAAADTLYEKDPVLRSGVVEYVLSPLVFAFTTWILQEAHKDGIRVLYFLARDGYPFYKAALQICAGSGIRTECRYLYCSRYSLRVPMYSEDPDEMLDYVCRNSIDVTFRKILLRSGLNPDQISEMEKAAGHPGPDEKIPAAALSEYKRYLRDHDRYLRMTAENSREKWRALQAYFSREGLLEHIPVGIVDSGWTGTTQKTFRDIRSRCGIYEKVTGYYFGIYGTPREISGKDYKCFYFNRTGGLLDKTLFSNCLFEAVFSADHGTTYGYSAENKAVLLLADHRQDSRKERLSACFAKYVESCLDHSRPDDWKSFDTAGAKRSIRKSLRLFMWEPTPEEAGYFGSFLFSDDVLDTSMREVAPVFSDDYVHENHFLIKMAASLGLFRHGIHESGWFEASAIRAGRHTLRRRAGHSLCRMIRFLIQGMGIQGRR